MNQLSALLNRRMLICALLGFSSGLPFYLLVSLLPAWFRTDGIGLKEIAFFHWLRVPYTWKFIWAPLVDRFDFLPQLGRRRDWALACQVGLCVCILALGGFRPSQSLFAVGTLALLTALFSATQDIAIDAYRRELLPELELGMGNALAVNAYRMAGLIPGGLALYLADRLPWSAVFTTVAAFMLIGIVTSMLAPDVENSSPPRDLRSAVVGPFKEFVSRGRVRDAVLLLAFFLLYKLGDTLATALVTPFYIDMGFSLTEIALMAKVVGFASMIAGSLLGGAVIAHIGINRSLWVFGLIQMISILGFVVLAEAGRNLWLLALVVVFEYLGVGLGTSAFIAFVARATSRAFTATQYALFSSFIALPSIALGSNTGWVAERVGYSAFFLGCTALAVPGLVLLRWVAPWHERAATGAPPTA